MSISVFVDLCWIHISVLILVDRFRFHKPNELFSFCICSHENKKNWENNFVISIFDFNHTFTYPIYQFSKRLCFFFSSFVFLCELQSVKYSQNCEKCRSILFFLLELAINIWVGNKETKNKSSIFLSLKYTFIRYDWQARKQSKTSNNLLGV